MEHSCTCCALQIENSVTLGNCDAVICKKYVCFLPTVPGSQVPKPLEFTE